MDIYHYRRGESPLLLSMPHSGTELPVGLRARLTPEALALPDTDWHVPRLYAFADSDDLDPTIVQATYSRYVIDLNRPPDNASLYPGQSTTELCPTTLFNGGALYREPNALSEDEIDRRRRRYWQPYHDKLAAELTRLKGRHGYALLYDCHSIPSRAPRFFAGVLPALNLGTARSQSCAPALERRLADIIADSGYSYAVNGRFIGGYITRRYGQPDDHVHALQMELGQDSYMAEGPSFRYQDDNARRLQRVLRRLLQTLLDWRPA